MNAIQSIQLGQIAPSKTNPRRAPTKDDVRQRELEESIRAHGVLQPVLVRPLNGKATAKISFELVAGHRRYAAATAAGLDEIPALVRELDDKQALEIQLIENLERADLHPLEEAEGYRQLMAVAKYDVARIAEKIGRSVKYVYDRVKLLQLTKESRQLFLDDVITAGHAIILARLNPKDQAAAIDTDVAPYRQHQALFSEEYSLWDPYRDEDGEPFPLEKKKSPYAGLKVRTVRELQAWVDQYVRFDATNVDPMLFPETVKELDLAGRGSPGRATTKKVIPITHSNFIQPSAREGRTYGPRSWKRADGLERSKTCELSVTGFVAVGPHRGDAFAVCVNKDKCTVHWGAEIRARAKRTKGASTGTSSREADRIRRAQEKDRLDRARRQAEEKRFEKALPALRAAAAKRVLELPATPTGVLADILVDAAGGLPKMLKSAVPRGKSLEDLFRFLAWHQIADRLTDVWSVQHHFPEVAATLGIGVKAILDETAPVQTAGKVKSGTCSKCGCTDTTPCDDGGMPCGWANRERTLCTACKGKKAARPRKNK